MDLVNQRDTADDDHFIRLYECVECGDKQVDIYKIIESKHLGKNKKLISEFGF
jgi:Zn ribbon nucleic-acid-binding protein